jgi:multiple sugar transport system permease protein
MTATIEELEPTTPPGRTLVLRPSVREALWGYLFVAPWLIGLALFTAGPMLASLALSVTDFNLVKPEAIRFVGLDNYIRLGSDPTIAQSLVPTF